MIAEFRHALRRLRGQTVGWAVGVALYGLLMAFFYPSVGQIENLDEFLSFYPEEMYAFFENMRALDTPMGYLDVYFFSLMHLIMGILAIGSGASLAVGDEERGTLDLVLAHPVSRTSLFWGRLLALGTSLAIIQVAGWLSWALPAGRVGFELSWLQLLRPFIPLFVVLLLFAAIALLLSMVMPTARIAAMFTGALLVSNFLLSGLANIIDGLQPVMNFTPLYYYQGGTAVEGLKVNWLAGLLTASLLLAAGAWLLFLRRDIRVSGERSWKWPGLRERTRA